MEENRLPVPSVEQISSVLNNAPMAIYVSDAETMELLYANPPAHRLFLRQMVEPGMKCYQAAGFESPCPFCRADQMNRGDFRVRKFRLPSNGRIYRLSGKLIDWDGRTAHIEYVEDITQTQEAEDKSNALREELQATFSNIPCGLCVYQFDGERISPIFHNPAFYNIMGYSEEHIEQVERNTDFLGVHPDDLAALQEKVSESIRCDGAFQHTYRVWNDVRGDYGWIRLDGLTKSQEDGSKMLYGVYSDVNERMRLQRELTQANEKMQGIINAIPGGVAIYRVSDIFETVYFSDQVPELSGYSVEEYRELIKCDAANLTYPEDTEMVVRRLHQAIRDRSVADFEFRKLHRDGHVVWVHVQASLIGEENGLPLLQCVFHNISALKETQLELDHLINSIPGGIASYQIEGERFIPTFFSDGVPALSGYTREEFISIVGDNAMNIIYEQDRERVLALTKAALESGEVLDVSYRMYHRDGDLIWIHLNGRRMGPISESMRFYAVFTGMSAESRLFQNIANESADGIYVVDQSNYDLLYVNESRPLFARGNCIGQKCYRALHGRTEPCEFCTLKSYEPDGQEHEMKVDDSGSFYGARILAADWNGIPAYIKYVREITEEVKTRREKERLEQYFQTIVKNIPGGLAVVRVNQNGHMTPEFLSDGFANMTGMSLEDAWKLYREDATTGVHPEDRDRVSSQMQSYIVSGESHCEIIYRLQTGGGGYVWVKNTLSLIRMEDGASLVYAVYHDVTRELEEQERMRNQYNDLILQHYRRPDPNALLVGHCNITRGKILDIIEYGDFHLLEALGDEREGFFLGLSQFVVDPEKRRKFLETYLDVPALAAFARGDVEQKMSCFVQMPGEELGRYVQFKITMVATPDSGDVTGILTVSDITSKIIDERIMQQLSVSGYDFVVDVDLAHDSYTRISCDGTSCCLPDPKGCHSQRVEHLANCHIVQRDREQFLKVMDPDYMKDRLSREGSYTIAISVADGNGDIRMKNLTVSALDLRIGRVCLSRTDITDSIREQQGLLRVIAYTFEFAGFIDIGARTLTLYTRKTVLENLSPHIFENYDEAIRRFIAQNATEESEDEMRLQFKIDTMLAQLREKPAGYDLLFAYRAVGGERYKQINILWGDSNHRTICLVRADVTDMLAEERQTKKKLESALALAEEANRAKSDFLSTMSHDIRTPMNAIMGMTALAIAHADDRQRVADCLQKISVSSKHLLSLINDILDMSKIERSKITLNRMKISVSELMRQLTSMMEPQARETGLSLTIRQGKMEHPYFYGDALRINQILINLLSNAIKFTPSGGLVDFCMEEIPATNPGDYARYRFTIRDTGIGMTEEFLAHIFDPFTRSERTGHIEGTGLGLSITKGLVDLMGGRIQVDSQVGQGTSFAVELECEPSEEGELFSSADAETYGNLSEEKALTGCYILVAEDNAINAEILCGILEMYGAGFEVKTDGAQAVAAFREAAPGTYDAILMDIQMPRMNGYEATRAIRNMDRADARSIPIVAMTANAFAEDVQEALDAGMTAHVAKPVDIHLLQSTLQKVLYGATIQ